MSSPGRRVEVFIDTFEGWNCGGRRSEVVKNEVKKKRNKKEDDEEEKEQEDGRPASRLGDPKE